MILLLAAPCRHIILTWQYYIYHFGVASIQWHVMYTICSAQANFPVSFLFQVLEFQLYVIRKSCLCLETHTAKIGQLRKVHSV